MALGTLDAWPPQQKWMYQLVENFDVDLHENNRQLPLTSFLRYCKDTTKVVILVTLGMPGQRNDSINL